MQWNFMFFLNTVLLGAGLAMDAFSVSVANGISEPKMNKGKSLGIAGTFGIFQGLMPLIGWVCVHTVVEYFGFAEKFVPYIALVLLLYIGIKMIVDCVKAKKEETKEQKIAKLGIGALLIQGIATSIDALSVGFTIEKYPIQMAICSALIIAVLTFAICLIGLLLGKKFGDMFKNAEIFGGIILIAIGIEIFVKGVFF